MLRAGARSPTAAEHGGPPLRCAERVPFARSPAEAAPTSAPSPAMLRGPVSSGGGPALPAVERAVEPISDPPALTRPGAPTTVEGSVCDIRTTHASFATRPVALAGVAKRAAHFHPARAPPLARPRSRAR